MGGTCRQRKSTGSDGDAQRRSRALPARCSLWQGLATLMLTLALLLGAGITRADNAALVKQALDLIYAGKPEQAFLLLVDREDELAGVRDYDYALGLAALDSGQAAMAIFVLQRVLAVDPLFSGARMDLARAYVETGQYEQAEMEFRILLAQDPPRHIIDAIDRYRARIRAATQKPGMVITAYLDTLAGYDTNANNATDERYVLDFTLDERSRRIESPYFAITGGTQLLLPASRTTLFYAGMNLGMREHIEAAFLDTLMLDGALAVRRLFSASALQLVLDGGRINVDGEENSSRHGASLEWRLTQAKRHVFALSVRSGAIDYADQYNIRNTNQTLYGFQYTHIWPATHPLSVDMLLNAGKDYAPGKTTLYERDIAQLRLSGIWPVDSALTVNGGLAATSFAYRQSPFGFEGQRSDRRLDLNLGLQYRLSSSLQLNTFLKFADQSSKVVFYDYQKSEFGIGLRWTFPAPGRNKP